MTVSNPKSALIKIQNTSALAEHLGLSRWTVSRVINGHAGVKAETAARVRAAIHDIGFLPNPMARSLRGGRTGTIGVCFQELESPLLARKTSILQQMLREENFNALIELTNRNRALEEKVIRHFIATRVEGIVLVGSLQRPTDAGAVLLAHEKVPVVLIDPEVSLPYPEVSLDREEAMRLVLEHLYSLGHRSFAVLGIDPEDAYGARRWRGIRNTAKTLGISLKTQISSYFKPDYHQHDYRYGEYLAGQLLRSGVLPTAVIALNDRVAMGAIKRLRAAGLEVPRDLSIVGYDNLDFTDYSQPTLTTVDQHVELLMQTARGILLRSIRDGNERGPQRQQIAPVLIERESTAPPSKISQLNNWGKIFPDIYKPHALQSQ